MKNPILLALFSIAVAAAGACTSFEHTSSLTSPTAGGNNALMGSWASSSSLIPTPSTCTNFVWNVTEQTATSARGSFSATCPGDLKLTGTAQGGFTSGSSIAWSGEGNATAPGLTSCAIKLTGTATLGTDSIVVPYDGTTCLGHVSGIETLRKR
ncbi:MAG: hypothetical protein ABI818_15150 [Acidobacteriota bacterium]